MKTLLMFILSAAILVGANPSQTEAKLKGEAQKAVQTHVLKNKLVGARTAVPSVELVRPMTGWENRWVAEGSVKITGKSGSSGASHTRRFTVILEFKDNKVTVLDVSV